MNPRWYRLSVFSFAIAVGVALPARSAHSQAILPPGFSDQSIASGLNFPTSMAPLGDGRVLIAEKGTHEVRLIINSVLVSNPVGTVDSVRDSPESGLLGVAIDPGFPARPYLYVYYDYLGAPVIRISRYNLRGDLSFTGIGDFTWDPASRYDLIGDLVDSASVHNGGTLRFGPDGMLYAAVGNDGRFCQALFVDQLIGKILRLDVSRLPDGPGGPPDKSLITPADNPFVSIDATAGLVWQYGLRNPYSFQIDAPTGNLYIADVGDNTYEELDLANQPGMNFGYPAYEGPMPAFNCPGQPYTGLTFPIYYYDRTAFLHGASIITAGVYHRPASGAARFPAEYDGNVFISDVGEGFLRRLQSQGTLWSVAPPVAGQPADSDWAHNMDGVTDYFVASDGALWYCKYSEQFAGNTGEIRKIVADQTLGVGPETAGLRFDRPRPLPAAGPVSLSWSLPAATRVSLVIHDIAGREVRRLVSDELESAGRHDRAWDGRDDGGRPLHSGVYFASLRTAAGGVERRVILSR